MLIRLESLDVNISVFLIAKKRKVTTDNLIILRIYGKKIENKINDVSIRKIN